MLGLIGAIFHLIGGLVVIFFSTLIIGLGFGGLIPDAPPGAPEALAGFGAVIIALAVVFIVLAFLGAFWMYSGDKSRTTWGGVLTLIIAIIALPTLWGFFFIGSLLGFIGAILGLVWNPTPAMPAPAAAPMPPPAAPTPPPVAPEPAIPEPAPEEPTSESEES